MDKIWEILRSWRSLIFVVGMKKRMTTQNWQKSHAKKKPRLQVNNHWSFFFYLNIFVFRNMTWYMYRFNAFICEHTCCSYLALMGENLKYLLFHWIFTYTIIDISKYDVIWQQTTLLGNHFSRTMFGDKRPYSKLVLAYFLVGISALSRIISNLLCKYVLCFLHRNLVINVVSICGNRFRLCSDALQCYNFFKMSVTPFFIPEK